jgi:hypothetical protein
MASIRRVSSGSASDDALFRRNARILSHAMMNPFDNGDNYRYGIQNVRKKAHGGAVGIGVRN